MRFAALWRAAVEIALLVFLLYSIRLMAEFTPTSGKDKSLSLALNNIFTRTNFTIAAISALTGVVVFEYLRKKR